MMDDQWAADQILQEIRAAEIDFSGADTRDGIRRIASALSDVRFVTVSECGLVEIIHDGAGTLVDLNIDEQALDRYEPKELANVITVTIQRGEVPIRSMLRKAAGIVQGEPQR